MCGSLFHAVKDVAVDVQSGLHIGVSQVVLQGLDIHTAFDTSGGVGVTQIMKPGILAAHLFNDAFVTVIREMCSPVVFEFKELRQDQITRRLQEARKILGSSEVKSHAG